MSSDIATPLTNQPVATTYVKQGSGGTPILLIHGFDSSVLEFRRLLPLLSGDNETWAVDLLGFGFTDRLSGIASYSPTAIKTHLYYFWKSLINQPVILVGASMGGATAIDFTFIIATREIPNFSWQLITGLEPSLPIVGDSVFYFLFNLICLTILAFLYQIIKSHSFRRIISCIIVLFCLFYFEASCLLNFSIPDH